MATSLHLIHKNFNWRIESLTPTHTTFAQKKFFNIDPLRQPEEITTGMTRGFAVRWAGSSEPDDPTDMYDRAADHVFELRIVYAIGQYGLGWNNGHELALQDRHDIVEELRDTSSYVGYDADNTSTDIDLKHRVLQSDTFNE
jgi:hypothetical protein